MPKPGIDLAPDWVRDLSSSLPPTLTVAQATKVLHKSRRTIYDYVETGALESIRPGGKRGVLIPRVSLIRFLRGEAPAQ